MKGWGLKTKKLIKAGAFVLEYTGELINNKMCMERIDLQHIRALKERVTFSLFAATFLIVCFLSSFSFCLCSCVLVVCRVGAMCVNRKTIWAGKRGKRPSPP